MPEGNAHLSLLELDGGLTRAVGVATSEAEFRAAFVTAFEQLHAKQLYLQIGHGEDLSFPSLPKAMEWLDSILKESFWQINDGSGSDKKLVVLSSQGNKLFDAYLEKAKG